MGHALRKRSNFVQVWKVPRIVEFQKGEKSIFFKVWKCLERIMLRGIKAKIMDIESETICYALKKVSKKEKLVFWCKISSCVRMQ
jgi:hypothetical protein